MRILLPLLVVCALAACGPSASPSDGGPDNLDPSSVVDAGGSGGGGAGAAGGGGGAASSGGGAGGGGGGEVDAGAEPDAGAVADAGPPVDAGSLVDAGAPVDAGTPFDAGSPMDAGVDAGCQCTLAQTCSMGRCVDDTSPPMVTVGADAGSSATMLFVAGTAIDTETGVTSVDLQLNSQAPLTVNVLNGAYAAALTVPMGRAEYTVTARARDRAGNQATASTRYDREAPTVVVTPSQDGACTSTGCTGAVIDASMSTFTLSAAVTEGLGLAAQHPVQVRVLDGTAELVAWTDLTQQASGTWSWTWAVLPALDFTRLTMEVAATDAAGNRGTATLRVLLDRVRPQVSFTPSANASCTLTACTGTIVNAATAALDLVGVASTDAALRLRVLDGMTELQAPVSVPQSNGSWTSSWTSFPSVDGRFLTLEVTATDALFNSASRQLTVLVDRALPGLVVNTPRPGTLVATAQVSVESTAIDGLGVQRVEVGTSAMGPSVAATKNANGDYEGSLAVPLVDAVEQTLTVRATDLAGNTRTTTTRYTADRVAPVLTLTGADFDCTGTGLCTGSVANAGTTQVSYGGTATDGSGSVTVRKTVLGSAGPVATSNDVVTSGSWSWAWTNLPVGVNGAGYALRVTATDAAGNASTELVRRTWLDNVAPTFSVPIAGQRNVDPNGVLFTSSEPMAASSVVAATRFAPAATSMMTFGSTDGRSFRFLNTPSLATYTPYTLTLGAATDRAGNAAAASTASFLTAPAAYTFPMRLVGAGGRRAPRIAVDEDGRFVVAYTVAGPVAGTYGLAFTYDVGVGATNTVWSISNTNVEVPVDLRITSSTRGADQRLLVGLDLASVGAGTGTSLLLRTLTSSWTATWQTLAPSAPMTIGATNTLSTANLTANRPSLERLPLRDLLGGGFGSYRSLTAPNNGATAMQTWSEGNPWSSVSSSTLSSLIAHDGRASLEITGVLGQSRVRFFDMGQGTQVTVASVIRSVTAQPALKALDRLGSVVPASASYVAWTTDTALTVACSASPFGATPAWQASTVTPPAGRTTGTAIASAMSSSQFVVAGEYGGDVLVYSTPLTACGTSPVVTLVGTVTGAREPAVTIDSSGRIWVAFVDAADAISVTRL